MQDAPHLLEGSLFIDDRGEVGFVNGLDMSAIKRFYTVRNHAQGFIRAWHGHKKECKFVSVTAGSALVCCVKVDNWQQPSKDATIQRFVLSAARPAVLYIPGGYANGFMSLSADCRMIFFSTATVEESKSDDFRFDSRYWDPWTIIER